MARLLKRFVQEETGATAIEYALIATLIALAIVVGATSLGNNLGIKYRNIGNSVASAGS